MSNFSKKISAAVLCGSLTFVLLSSGTSVSAGAQNGGVRRCQLAFPSSAEDEDLENENGSFNQVNNNQNTVKQTEHNSADQVDSEPSEARGSFENSGGKTKVESEDASLACRTAGSKDFVYKSASAVNDSKNPSKVAPSLIAKAGPFTALLPVLIGAFIVGTSSNSSKAPSEPDIPVSPAPKPSNPKPDVPVSVQEHSNKTWLWITLGGVGIIAVLVIGFYIGRRKQVSKGCASEKAKNKSVSKYKLKNSEISPKLDIIEEIVEEEEEKEEEEKEENCEPKKIKKELKIPKLDLSRKNLYARKTVPFARNTDEYILQSLEIKSKEVPICERYLLTQKIKLAKKYKPKLEAKIAVLNEEVEKARLNNKSEKEIEEAEENVSKLINSFYSQKVFDDFTC